MDRPPNDPPHEPNGSPKTEPKGESKGDQRVTPEPDLPARTAAQSAQSAQSVSRPGRAGRRVLVLYNCDYDAPVTEPIGSDADKDRSAVALAANQVRDAIEDYGYEALISGVFGHDLADCLAHVRGVEPDLIFNLTESLNQDSRNEIVFPSILDMLGIPFTGTGALGLGLCLHKPKAKDILRGRGIPTPASCVIERAKDAAGVDLPYPLFVKLAHEDASVGIRHDNVVHNKRALVRRIRNLLEEFNQPVLIERYIEGREVNVTLLGNARVTVLPFHEIDFSKLPPDSPRIVSYAAKWDESSPEYMGTVPIPVKDIS